MPKRIIGKLVITDESLLAIYDDLEDNFNRRNLIVMELEELD